MKKNNDASNEEMFEFNNLIQKEKEGALQSFRGQDFRSQLSRKIEQEAKTPLPSVFWLRKPVIAVGTVVLLIVLGWAATKIFGPSPSESEAKAIKKIIVQAVNLHGNMLAQGSLELEPEPGESDIYEFGWSLKRVIFSIQSEGIPDKDIPRIFSRVLQNAAAFKTAEEKEPGELKPNRKNISLEKENNFHQLFSQI
jgi:hypothetical protein